MSMFNLAISFDHFQFTLIHGPNIPGSYAILLFIALDFTSITSHIYNWLLLLFWQHLFILSGVISPLISSSILGTYRPGEFFFQCLSFCLFILFMGFSRQENWSGLPFPFPMDHVLSELSTMTHLSWVALHGMAHSFTELDKAVVHVIKLVSFLWLWFSVCLPSDGEGWEAYGSFLMGETDWATNSCNLFTQLCTEWRSREPHECFSSTVLSRSLMASNHFIPAKLRKKRQLLSNYPSLEGHSVSIFFD